MTRAIIGQRRSLPVTPLGYLNFKKVIFRTMPTMWKLFPVNFYTNGSFTSNGRNTVKSTAWTIVFVWTARTRTSSIAARISVEHKMRGFYKEDHTSDRVDLISVERGREKKPIKGFEYFSQGHDQESCGKHLFLLWLIFCTVFQIGQLAIILY